jgi:hypothetical protein
MHHYNPSVIEMTLTSTAHWYLYQANNIRK